MIIAVRVNSDGRREVLGMDIGPSGAETFWTAFLRKLARRALRGVKLLVSDAHEGIKATVAKGLNVTRSAAACPLHAQRAGACRQEWPTRRLRLHRHRLYPGRRRSGTGAVAIAITGIRDHNRLEYLITIPGMPSKEKPLEVLRERPTAARPCGPIP